ncbi:phosphatidylinositol 5-phosphate 4-kinase type-2 alpha isoform X3 [Ictalurus punctatus]|uniref:Phosphatidylinositol 5-phosphate 4-kinase type-2 alpha n=1 Tax=Ictalurus punctatus TaxID=7998 RepID=A0A2D0TAF9_ICTPU|nr:phosphatidylinositol 5-phosphate 4-kinase type-2 alpha isoform X3 [Ictalurus punctatus]XP_053507109.1 phosphatidylinositol 5-phosphate 4-kinase type-2 alpha isoform X4 [Ictalurus furcatus]
MASGVASLASSIASKTKTKKKHFMPQKKKLFRSSDPLLSVLMWGVHHSINNLSHIQIPVMLMPDDFKANSKIKVDNHLFNKENMPSHFKFKEYCPLVFRNLRERFSIDDQEYQNSLTRSAPIPSDAQGRSGARFHTSYNKKYVIKIITSEDVAEMHNILKKYHQYIVECHGNTLLPQFLGMYRLTVDGDETYMIVTRNVFSPRLPVHKKYDLKGSTVSREASDKEKTKELPTYKDNDFINDGQKIYIDEENKKMFLEKLKNDVEFLAQLKLMDYSLLVGLHDVERGEQEQPEEEIEDNEGGEEEGAESDGGVTGSPPESPSNTLDSNRPLGPGEFDPSVDVYAIRSHENAPKKEVYFMAVIDILTPYDAKKKAAHAAKTVKHGAGAEISTVNPEQYSKRFYDFITTILS